MLAFQFELCHPSSDADSIVERCGEQVLASSRVQGFDVVDVQLKSHPSPQFVSHDLMPPSDKMKRSWPYVA